MVTQRIAGETTLHSGSLVKQRLFQSENVRNALTCDQSWAADVASKRVERTGGKMSVKIGELLEITHKIFDNVAFAQELEQL